MKQTDIYVDEVLSVTFILRSPEQKSASGL